MIVGGDNGRKVKHELQQNGALLIIDGGNGASQGVGKWSACTAFPDTLHQSNGR